MCNYRHTQPGAVIRWSFALTVLVLAAFAVALRTVVPLAAIIDGVVILILLACLVLFHSLTVEVRPEHVVVRFGPGWIRKRIPISAIREAAPVRNRWFYGWGIRRTPHGWLWNVSGFDAVEVLLVTGKRFRIGTDEPERLCAAIEDAVASSRTNSRV